MSPEEKKRKKQREQQQRRRENMSEEAKAKEREKAAARIREKRENEEYRLAELQRQRAARLASSPEASDSRRQANRQGMSRTRHDPDSSRQQRDVEYSRQYRQANPGYVEAEHLRLHQMYHAHVPVRQQWDRDHDKTPRLPNVAEPKRTIPLEIQEATAKFLQQEAERKQAAMNKGCLNDIHEKCTKCKDENGKSCDFCEDCWIQHGEQFPDHL